MHKSEDTPMGEIVARLDSMISDFKSVTPESLKSLKEDIMDMKGYMDESGESEMGEDEGKSGILLTISNMRKKKPMKGEVA